MTSPTPIVHVIDDDESVRNSLRFLLGALGVQVQVHEAPAPFLEGFVHDRPCCLIVDLRMPGMSGLELHEKLRARGVRVPVVVITGHGDVPAAVRAFRSGVNDFLEKPFSDDVLLTRVQDLLKLDAENRRTRALVEDVRRKTQVLTKREREVIELVVAGKPNKQIAVELGVGVKAIEAHRARIMEKMGADSVQELVSSITIYRQWRED